MKNLFTASLALFVLCFISANAQASTAYRLMDAQQIHSGQQAIELPLDTVISVLQTQADAQGAQWLHLGIDSDQTAIPSDIWVRADELRASSLEPIEMTVEDEIFSAMGKKMTYCYKFVKEYLMHHGFVRGYIPGGSAYMAAGYLPQYGFHRTGLAPGHSRVNDICVYSGGRGGNGHIEILTAQGWYYGYGFKSAPITSVNHRLISCFAK